MASLPEVLGVLSDATKLKFSGINSTLTEMLCQNVITDNFASLAAWTEVDGDGKVNLSDGVVTLDGGNIWDTHGIRYTAGFTRAAGYFEIKLSLSTVILNAVAIGITNSAALFKSNASGMCGVSIQGATNLNAIDAAAYASSQADIASATYYTLRFYVSRSGDNSSWKKLKVTIQGGVYANETDVGVFNQIITAFADPIYFSVSRYLSDTNKKASVKEFRWYSNYATDAPYTEYIHDAGAGKVFDNFDPSALALPGTVPSTNLTFKWSFDDGTPAYSAALSLANLNLVAKQTERHRYIRLQVIHNSDGPTQVYGAKPNASTATDGVGDWADLGNVRDNDTNQGTTGALSSDDIIDTAAVPGNYRVQNLNNDVILTGLEFGLDNVGRHSWISGINPPRLKTAGGETINILGFGFTTAEHLYFDETEVAFSISDDEVLQVDSTPAMAVGIYSVRLTGTGFEEIGYNKVCVEYDDKIYSAAEEIARNEIPDLSKIPTAASGGPAAWLQRNVSRIGTWNLTTWEAARNTALKAFYKLGEVFKLLGADTAGEYAASGVPAPGKVANVKPVALSTSEIVVTHNAVPLAESYRHYRNGNLISTVTDKLAYSHRLLAADTSFSFQVQAVNRTEPGTISDAVSGHTLKDAMQPPDDDFNNSLEDDLDSVFFGDAEFAEDITLVPGTGLDPYTIKAIFDNEYQSVDPETNQIISSTAPAVRIRVKDLTAPLTKTDLFIIRNCNFMIDDLQPDGTGTILIILKKVS